MKQLVSFVQEQFAELADPRKAKPMAAYMKTDMPFYGVPKPQRVPVYREMKKRFPITDNRQYVQAIESLWSLPHREEKYAALHLAMSYPQFMTPDNLPFYKRLIIEGAWWDFVDDISIRMVGTVVLEHRATAGPKMDRWIEDSNMWVRRCALICHIKHKEKTNQKQMFTHCLRRADETEFFIRKAIGWTLREYAWTAPDRVRRFLKQHGDKLSPLSFREAAKHLKLK